MFTNTLLRFLHLPIYWEGEGGSGGGTGDDGTGDAGNQGGDKPWYDGTVDPSHHDWVKNKQFADVNAALTSYRSLEQVMGRQRLAIPADEKDTAAYDAIYKTLGRPTDPKEYKVPDGVKLKDGVFDKFAPIFHKAGLGQSAVNEIIAGYNAIAMEGQKTPEQIAAEEDRQEQELKTAWGEKYQANTDLAGRAWRALGLDEKQSNAIEEALGFKGFMEFFHKVGSGMGEHGMKLDGGQGDTNSVERAKTERDRLFADKSFMERYTSHNALVRKQAMAELEPWMKILANAKDAARAG